MLSISERPLLNHLKNVDRILSTDEVLRMDVDEYKIFRELDRAGYVFPRGPPMSPPARSVRESLLYLLMNDCTFV